MSLQHPIHLSEVHSELSCILYAVQTGLKDLGVTVHIDYNQYTYLGVRIELWPRSSAEETRKQITAIVARLQHGILHDEYDYRFNAVAYPPLDSDLRGWDHYEISATLDMQHWPHRRTNGWDMQQKPLEWPISAARAAAAPPAHRQ
jgi:hypothetical protein